MTDPTESPTDAESDPVPTAEDDGAPIDLEQHERRIVLRPLRADDFERLVELQEACFPGLETWTRDRFESMLRHFPEGQLGIELEGELVASAASLIVDYDDYSDWHDYREVADDGYIRNHDPEGDTLYGIELMVHPDHRGLKLSRRLYQARRDLARRYNLARSIVGGRIPGYHRYADRMTAREYAEQVVERGLYDPVLTTQVANGFVLKRLIPDYFPEDTASRGYATQLEWTNLDHRPPRERRLQRVSNVRIATVQYGMRQVRSFEEFGWQCEFFIDTASEYKSDFVLFPELLTTQLLSFVEADSPVEAARELAKMTPQYLDFFTEMAVKYNVNIVGGSQFAIEDDALRNIAYLFRRDGTIEKQYKIHITPAERKWWGVAPGDKMHVFDTDRGRIAIQVCYDIEFPELTRIAAGQGAQIIFVPFNTDRRDGYLRIRHCAQARCIENHVYVAVSGCTGNLPMVDNADIHYAQSGIFTPCDFSFARDGVAAECSPNVETLVIHDVDVELLRRHKLRGSTQNWNDRRTDLYSVTWRDEEGGERRV